MFSEPLDSASFTSSTFTVVDTPFTVTVTATEPLGVTSHGTCTVIWGVWPLTLATLKMGAAVPLNETASDASRYGKGPNKLPEVTMP